MLLFKYMLIAVVTKKENLKKLAYAIGTLIFNTMPLTALLWSVNATVCAAGSLVRSVLSSRFHHIVTNFFSYVAKACLFYVSNCISNPL